MENKLKEYERKRNFKKTKEPKPSLVNKNKKQNHSFVIQYHEATKNHYDFRLEHKGVLLSWAVPKGPSFNPEDKRLAIKVEDHPLEYANFEGTIPKDQYGGGTVMLFDFGTYTPLNDFTEGLKKGTLKFELQGKRIKGKWALIKIKENSKETPSSSWLLIKEKDSLSKKTSGISKYKTSIKSNKTLDELKEFPKNPFQKLEVQLAKPVTSLTNDDTWLYELKYDGYRIVTFLEANTVKLYTRNHLDYTNKFEIMIPKLLKFSNHHSMVLDGEMVYLNKNGTTDFESLQNAIKTKSQTNLAYMIFDILALDGEDLRSYPQIKRKEILEKLFKSHSIPGLNYSSHIIGNGNEVLKEAKKLNIEGLIGKKINSKYIEGRSSNWIKIKFRNIQEFIILGYTIKPSSSSLISSILLGVYESKKNLIYVGKVGTGFSKKTIKELKKEFDKLEIKTPKITNKIPIKKDEKIVYLKPKLLANIEYAEMTKNNLLRQASFKGLRKDKLPTDVHLDFKIHLSNPDKIIYPNSNITKKDIYNYYDLVSNRMLKILENRILSVIRCHKGITNECFFKKHPLTTSDNVETIKLKNSKNEIKNYFYIKDKSSLLSQVQLGTLEFHIWGSNVDEIDKPNLMVFDLDPDENLDIKKIRTGVKDLKKILDELKLKSFLKTSGGKGYHIIVPFINVPSWEKFSSFAKNIASTMEKRWPDRYTSNIRKNKREGKIFIDWLRNTKGATSIAPYSLKARPNAPVSMPISYKDLDTITPNEIDIYKALERLKKRDPWESLSKIKQTLK